MFLKIFQVLLHPWFHDIKFNKIEKIIWKLGTMTDMVE